jgi:hypothetical protein
MDLFSNCSEFTFRIPMENIGGKQLKKLETVIEKLEQGNYNLKEYIEWFGVEAIGKEPFEAYGHEVSLYRGLIMGRDCITIKGETGDHGTFVMNMLNKLGVVHFYEDDN